MSKKKSFSGSTMTLRDFHGGSIPSDLPLPSAPGMVVERKFHDRPGSGGWMGSSFHRGYGGERVVFLRQGSGTFARSYEEKVSYMPNPANIGRNYDEDERKPVDGGTRGGQVGEYFEEQAYDQRHVGHERLPERYKSDTIGSYTTSKYMDPRADRPTQEDLSSGSSNSQLQNFPRRPSTYPQEVVSQDQTGYYQSQAVRQHSPYLEPVQPWRQNTQQPIAPGNVMGSGSGVQNVWSARREGEHGSVYPTGYNVHAAGMDGRAQTAGLSIAQASALEKVSSGRWNSRTLQPSNEPPQQEYVQPYSSPYEGGDTYSLYNSARSPAGIDHAVCNDSSRKDLSRAAYMESGRGIDTWLEIEKGSLQYAEGRGVSQLESGRYVDDRHGFGEGGWKGTAGHQQSARYIGSNNNTHTDPVYSSFKDSPRSVGDEAYVEARNMSWMRPEPYPKTDYVDEKTMDSSIKGFSFDLDRRSVVSGERDNEEGIVHSSYSFEGERDPHFVGSYHKDDLGQRSSPHPTSPYPKGKQNSAQEVPGSAKGGRFNDINRGPVGPEFDQSHAGHLHPPGNVHASVSHEIGGPVNVVSSENEAKSLPAERPKLKLLPRTKPIEVDPMEEFVQEEEEVKVSESSSFTHSEDATGSGSITTSLTIGTSIDEPIQAIERRKLSLKPRSQPVETDSGSVKERVSVFGGARPRELVLKERGVEELVIVGIDLTPGPSPSIRQLGRQETGQLERNESRGRKEFVELDRKEDRRGYQREPERPDVNKQDSWRRPSEISSGPQSPMPVAELSIGGTGRAIQSAAELAQAFSRSSSFGSGFVGSASEYLNQRPSMPRSPGLGLGMGVGSPGYRKVALPNDVPFSRLTEALSPGPRNVHASGVQGGYKRTSAF